MSNCAALSGLYGNRPRERKPEVFYARSTVSTFEFVGFRDVKMHVCLLACHLRLHVANQLFLSNFPNHTLSHGIGAHIALNGENVFALMSLISLRFSFFSLRFWLKP
jgi:hypothetical protein